MNQQINLVNIALIKQKPFLTLNSVAAVLATLVLILLAYYTYSQKEISTLSLQRQQVADDLIKTQNEVKALALLHAPQEIDASLEKLVTKLEQKIKVQQQILEILSHSTNTPDNSYAALMRAFARQSIEGLWLTGFSVDSQTDTLNIQGRALQSDLVPQYINRLSNEPALKGKLFSGLSISLPKADNLINNPSAANTTSQAQSDKISTVTGKPNVQNSLTTINLPNYIEFSLESTLDNSSIAVEPASRTGDKS
ncbi:MAG: PilN domain-containing protein [Methylotenera sp.]|uniref:PilN domain-containing protein n=1 Tax=Methylotenera sp. TaxID=2051956 RepID=UPI00271C5BEA|nr:PilN domain-containing protein [Methylotenera sp.]MDO9150385.1 PilN domain-containing protein [Methylotenera sp.]